MKHRAARQRALLPRVFSFSCAFLPAALLLVGTTSFPQPAAGADLNLAVVTCGKYENEVLTGSIPGYSADAIDTVMWLFGYATAKAGDRVMYGDSLKEFGFALDAECKNNPSHSLLDAVVSITSKRANPMDLTHLDCATFATRHQNLEKSDPESANTLTMWLFGYAVGLAGSHILNADDVHKFDAGLLDHCTKRAQDSVFEALSAANPAIPKTPGAPQPAARR
jgi:hypothetical protein